MTEVEVEREAINSARSALSSFGHSEKAKARVMGFSLAKTAKHRRVPAISESTGRCTDPKGHGDVEQDPMDMEEILEWNRRNRDRKLCGALVLRIVRFGNLTLRNRRVQLFGDTRGSLSSRQEISPKYARRVWSLVKKNGEGCARHVTMREDTRCFASLRLRRRFNRRSKDA